MVPEIKYARGGDVHVAYQVVGDGPVDIVLADNWISHLEERWKLPAWSRFMTHLARIGRLIIFDMRGVGLSDPVPLGALPSIEQWVEDVRLVMDAAKSERAVLIGGFDAGPMAMVFAATHPDRTKALVLVNSYARFARDQDYPAGAPPDALENAMEMIKRTYGTAHMLTILAPSIAGDEESRRWIAGAYRSAGSPGTFFAMVKAIQQIDVRHVLPKIRVPTLVVHRTDARWIRVGHGRYLGQHIPNAKYVELPGEDSMIFTGDQDALLGEIDVFLTGTRQAGEIDRVLAAVVFADIVGSTEHATRLGDRAWHDLLDRYYRVVRRELTRFSGREIDTAGDGVFATFDGPRRAIGFATALREEVRRLGIEVRVGLHAGECEVVGPKVGGIAVHIGARVMAAAGAGEIFASSTIKDLMAGSEMKFVDRGVRALKGVPGEWRLFAVE